MTAPLIDLTEFLKRYMSRPDRFGWFLGAGVSRNAGMPSADDLIWELKLRHYCLLEGQDIAKHDLGNKAIKNRIQSYFESKNAPPRWANEEYSFFFELLFGTDYAAQQRFIEGELNPKNISLNIGNRVLAALMALDLAKVVFTTNFDDVLEQAYAGVSGKNLTAFNLEGSVAALDALNGDKFPIYAKLHGDFRYRSIKNLSADLKHNDEELQRAFLATSARFGAVVTGYSGRDANVMAMFEEAIKQNNAFPAGLFWCVPKRADTAPAVCELIEKAKAAGIDAAIVETATFDILMSRLWSLIRDKPAELAAKVQPNRASVVSIPLPPAGKALPLLRMNALPVTALPDKCGRLECVPPITYEQLRDGQHDRIPDSVMAISDGLLYWGRTAEVTTFIPAATIKSSDAFSFADALGAIRTSTVHKAMFEHALAKALCHGKPVVLRKRGKALYAVASDRAADQPHLKRLAAATGGNERAAVTGQLRTPQATWTEAVHLRLEERAGSLYLLLQPDIWIKPLKSREESAMFMRQRRLKRWNQQADQILNAWISILVGDLGQVSEAVVTAFPGEDYPASFTLRTRTAYSRQEALRGN